MRTDEPTDTEVRNALEILTLAASWSARERSDNDPRGLSGQALADRSAECARAASMSMSNLIVTELHKHKRA